MKTIEQPKTGKATRPASRWRNRYLAFNAFRERGGRTWIAGQEDWGTREWPSRDTAETYGRNREAKYPADCKYLGAFPIEGA